MRVVVLARASSRSLYFANAIHERFPLAGLVLEELPPLRERVRRRFRKVSAADVLGSAAARLARRFAAPSGGLDPAEILGPRGERLDSSIPVHRVRDVNAEETVAHVRALDPDVLLVRGTSIVRDPMLETVDVALNLHAGLSPWYRGTHCTEWALIHWDPLNIGPTLHALTHHIDGGDVFAQARVAVEPRDTVASIEAKIAVEGANLANAALARLDAEGELMLYPQDRSLGHLTLSRQWSPACDLHMAWLQRESEMTAMLKRPSRPALPLVEVEA